MIKGKEKQGLITYEEVLKKTQGGYDLMMYYHGSVPKRCKSPFRKDTHPSFGFVFRNGVLFWKDMADESSGTAIEYIQKRYNLTFVDAMKKVLFDFGWSTKEINANPIKITWEKKKEEIPIHITVDSQPFTKKHQQFWGCVEVTEKDCNKLECWALKSPFSINRKLFRLKKDEIAFFYYAPEIDKVKLYFPERRKDDRFLNNCGYFYLWNLRNINKCEDLIVTKSYKDLIVTSIITPCVIATQAEAVQIFTEETVSTINSLATNVWVWYGSDPDGVKKCQSITATNKWRYINTPKNLLPDINDNYGFVKAFGMKRLEEFMKSKKFPL